jgi:hypothetical protein
MHLYGGHFECPTCELYLGADFAKVALADRTLGNLVDRVFFPHAADQDARREAKFYRRRGIAPKESATLLREQAAATERRAAVVARQQTRTKRVVRATTGASSSGTKPGEESVTLRMIPEQAAGDRSSSIHRTPPPLKQPFLRTKGSLRMVQLKKYLQNKLPKSGDAEAPPRDVDILCNGTSLGNEVSVNSVMKCIWLGPPEELTLTYRYSIRVKSTVGKGQKSQKAS